MKKTLRSQLSVGFILIVFVTIGLVSLCANILINKQFAVYMENKQRDFSKTLAEGIEHQYNEGDSTWNVDYIHGVGMYALNDGYIIKVYDTNNRVIWDAQNHDTTLCHTIMTNISISMQERRPELDGGFETYEYNLEKEGVELGRLEVSYYSPYYLSDSEFKFLDSLNLILIIIGTSSIICSIISALVLASKISSPIRKTIQMAKEISNGNYGMRFEGKTNIKELSDLTYTVNQMASTLEVQENLRKRLTTDVAHELRTPLANVASHLEAMIEDVWEPTKERIQGCYDEIIRISSLVNDLQRLTQIESDNLKLEKQYMDLYKLSQEVVRDFGKEIFDKKIDCVVEGEASIIFADKNRIHQVISNLLSNAIKYSNEETKIYLSVVDKDSYGILTVKDCGIGMLEHELPYIFERFYRTDKSRSRKTGGAGIGLSIVKSIVQAHNGSIDVKSQVGEGSEFIIALPK